MRLSPLRITTFVLSLMGLSVAIYMTIAHFTTSAILACSSTGTIDCAAVTTSPESYVLGIPVAVLGLANYVAMVGLNSPWAWRSAREWVHIARRALSFVSMAFVLWLVYAELIIINHICLWCTSVHVITFILFILISVESGRRIIEK